MIMIPFELIYLVKWTSSATLVYALNLNQGWEVREKILKVREIYVKEYYFKAIFYQGKVREFWKAINICGNHAFIS